MAATAVTLLALAWPSSTGGAAAAATPTSAHSTEESAATYVPTCLGLATRPATWTPYCGDAGWYFSLTWDKWTSEEATAHGRLSWHVGAGGPHGELAAKVTFDEPVPISDSDPSEYFMAATVSYNGRLGPNGVPTDLLLLDQAEMTGAVRSSPRVLPECPSGSLNLALDDNQSGLAAGGNLETDFTLRNVGRVSCELVGFPGIEVRTSRGDLPLRLHWGDWPGTSFGLTVIHWPVVRVDLAPGARARFAMIGRCDGGYRVPAAQLRVYPPDASQQLAMNFPAGGGLPLCVTPANPRAADPGNEIWVSPVQPA